MDEKKQAESTPEPVRAPSPESVDQTKSGVTAEALKAFEDAAPQPYRPAKGTGQEAQKNEKAHHSKK